MLIKKLSKDDIDWLNHAWDCIGGLSSFSPRYLMEKLGTDYTKKISSFKLKYLKKKAVVISTYQQHGVIIESVEEKR